MFQVETSIIDYTCNVSELKGISRGKVAATLAEVGFSEEGQAAPIASLSGGWKMKLALARAMLQNAQVWQLLLVEYNCRDMYGVVYLLSIWCVALETEDIRQGRYRFPLYS